MQWNSWQIIQYPANIRYAQLRIRSLKCKRIGTRRNVCISKTLIGGYALHYIQGSTNFESLKLGTAWSGSFISKKISLALGYARNVQSNTHHVIYKLPTIWPKDFRQWIRWIGLIPVTVWQSKKFQSTYYLFDTNWQSQTTCWLTNGQSLLRTTHVMTDNFQLEQPITINWFISAA